VGTNCNLFGHLMLLIQAKVEYGHACATLFEILLVMVQMVCSGAHIAHTCSSKAVQQFFHARKVVVLLYLQMRIVSKHNLTKGNCFLQCV
jgi:hypothetical protein